VTEVVRYRLELPAAAEPFRREIEFALDFVAEAYPIRRDPAAERSLRYGHDLPARFFPDAVRADPHGLHLDAAAFARLEDFWPRDGAGGLSYDALGVIFFMLSRIEERGAASRDRHGRFDPAQAAAVRAGLHDSPVADRAAADLAHLLTGQSRPPARSFEVVPTHDVDSLRRYHIWWEPLRYAAGDLLKRGAPRAAAGRFKAYRPGEPFGSFRDAMALSERFGLKSRFFMMGPSRDPMDSPYAASMPQLLRRVADEVASRGHEIGFHPGYRTFDDPAEWGRQRAGLERVIGVRVRSGRQHVLRYRAEITPAIWDEAGMTEDFTLAYPGACGFRNGTCASHRAYDLVRRQAMTLRQTATAVMDFALFDKRYRMLSLEQALAEAGAVAGVVKAYRGRLVVLHHTGQAEGRARDFYERFLEEIL
jgi:hypothetical protein